MQRKARRQWTAQVSSSHYGKVGIQNKGINIEIHVAQNLLNTVCGKLTLALMLYESEM